MAKLKPLELQNLNMNSPIEQDYQLTFPVYVQKTDAIDGYIIIDKNSKLDHHIINVKDSLIANEWFNSSGFDIYPLNTKQKFYFMVGTTPMEAAIDYSYITFPLMLEWNSFMLAKVKAWGNFLHDKIHHGGGYGGSYNFRCLKFERIEVVDIIHADKVKEMILNELDTYKKGPFWTALAAYTRFFHEKAFFDRYGMKIPSKNIREMNRGICMSEQNDNYNHTNRSTLSHLRFSGNKYCPFVRFSDDDIEAAKTNIDIPVEDLDIKTFTILYTDGLRKFNTKEVKDIVNKICMNEEYSSINNDSKYLALILANPYVTTTVLDDVLNYVWKNYLSINDGDRSYITKQIEKMVQDIILECNEFTLKRLIKNPKFHIPELLKNIIKFNPYWYESLLYKIASIDINLMIPILKAIDNEEEPYLFKLVQTLSRKVAITDEFCKEFDEYIDYGAASHILPPPYQIQNHWETIDFKECMAEYSRGKTNYTWFNTCIDFYKNSNFLNQVLEVLKKLDIDIATMGLFNNPTIDVEIITMISQCPEIGSVTWDYVVLKNQSLIINNKVTFENYFKYNRECISRGQARQIFLDYPRVENKHIDYPYLYEIEYGEFFTRDEIDVFLGLVNLSTDIAPYDLEYMKKSGVLELRSGAILPEDRIQPVENIKKYISCINYLTRYEFNRLVKLGEIKEKDKVLFEKLVIN